MLTPSMLSYQMTPRTARRLLTVVTASAVALLGTAFTLVGCGGGGGATAPVGTPTPGVSPTPTPTITPAPTPTPVVSPTPGASPTPTPSPVAPRDRSISQNFLPNYIPANPDNLLHWPNNKNLSVYIRPTVNNIRDAVPSNAIDPAKAIRVVSQALAAWNSATGGDFVFHYVNSSNEANIEVVFVETLRRRDGSTPPGVGLTFFDFTNPNPADGVRGELTKAIAQVQGVGTEEALVDVTAHEIGHSLGIIQHSSDPNDLLFATSTAPVSISERDLNTLFYLYYSHEALGRAVPAPGRTGIHHGETVCEP